MFSPSALKDDIEDFYKVADHTRLRLVQEAFVVPDMRTKRQFQLAGIGFGFVPAFYASSYIASGLLVVKQVEESKPSETFYLAWRSGEEGEALKWWIASAQKTTFFKSLQFL